MRRFLREEAEILTFSIVFVVRNFKMFCESEDVLFWHPSKRKQYSAQLRLREAIEEITLIFRKIDGFKQKMTIRSIC